MVWLKYLMIFGSIQGFLLAIAVLTIGSPRKNLINRLFAFLILSISIYLFINSSAFFLRDYPKIYLLSFSFIFCYTPIFHLFILALTRDNFKLERKHFLHFIALLIYFIALAPWLIGPTEEIVSGLFAKSPNSLVWVDYVGISINLYFTISVFLLIARNRKIWTGKQLHFLKLFWVVVISSNLIWLMAIALPNLGLRQVAGQIYMLNWLFTSFLIYFFSYFVIIRSEFFTTGTRKTYSRISIPQNDLSGLQKQITQTLSEQKPYKNPEFSLSDLATLSGIEKIKLSLVINREMETSFFELVNKYRVQEFIDLIQSGKYTNYNLQGIATEAGFKSKSTFYKAFKASKGCSPKNYFDQFVSGNPT